MLYLLSLTFIELNIWINIWNEISDWKEEKKMDKNKTTTCFYGKKKTKPTLFRKTLHFGFPSCHFHPWLSLSSDVPSTP